MLGKEGQRQGGGRPVNPSPIGPDLKVAELVDNHFNAYNAARLREACLIYSEKILRDDASIGLGVSGALTPAGLGASALVPLIEQGFVDWIVSTGANLYHDIHFGLGITPHQTSPFTDDDALRRDDLVRIYDLVISYSDLLSTDRFIEDVMEQPELQRKMGTAELHYLLGKYLARREDELRLPRRALLSAAYRCGVPVYTSSPGDSSIGISVALLEALGNKLEIDMSRDVHETAAIVLAANKEGKKTAAVILGGGSPKNFILQTEPLLKANTTANVAGHHYFIQITDARPDTGGLSGATPSEAMTWGKVTPESLPDAVVVYADITIALPLLTAYLLSNNPPRARKRLYEQRDEMVAALKEIYVNTPEE